VTDQGRSTLERSGSIPPSEAVGLEQPEIPRSELLVCVVCGRLGDYSEDFYRTG
jgi:hypothetical protein